MSAIGDDVLHGFFAGWRGFVTGTLIAALLSFARILIVVVEMATQVSSLSEVPDAVIGIEGGVAFSGRLAIIDFGLNERES